MSNIDEEYPDFEYKEIKKQTHSAYLFLLKDNSEVWIPKSQIELDEVDKIFNIPYWLAEEKGMIL